MVVAGVGWWSLKEYSKADASQIPEAPNLESETPSI